MEQTSLYDFLKEEDPLYSTILRLEIGQKVNVGKLEIRRNEFGNYEVSTPDFHEGYSEASECYEFVKGFLQSN